MGKRIDLVEGDIVRHSGVPYGEEFRALSGRITDDVGAGDYDSIEAAGRLSLAAMLLLYADGRLDPQQGYMLLKGLADRKTPAPVSRIEEVKVVDMRVLIGEAIEANPDRLDRAIGLARERREGIKRRLGMGDTLEIVDGEVDRVDSGYPDLPDEVRHLRSGRVSREFSG